MTGSEHLPLNSFSELVNQAWNVDYSYSRMRDTALKKVFFPNCLLYFVNYLSR